MPTNPEFIATRILGMKVEAAASELLRYSNMTIRNTLEALESMRKPRTLQNARLVKHDKITADIGE